MINKLITSVERTIKGKLFGCQMCGQCELSYTGMRCPMNCPKGLRNGPCGGTTSGKCEVFPEEICTWMEIKNGRPQELPLIHAPLNRELINTSSYVNLLTGRDKETRKPVSYLPINGAPQREQLMGRGRLERVLQSGEFAVTTECHSPKTEKGLARVHRFGRAVAGFVDAVNTTSSPQGNVSLSSRRTAAELKKFSIEAVIQVCGRDVLPEEFIDELAEIKKDNYQNLLCLTGDWNRFGLTRKNYSLPEGFFPMDSGQMIYEVRYTRETGQSAFVKEKKVSHSIFIGGAANPYSTPVDHVITRLKQKCAAGVDFFQTQIVTETETFLNFWKEYIKAGLHNKAYLLASIPVITNPKSLKLMKNLAGVHVAPEYEAQFTNKKDWTNTGIKAAIQIAKALKVHNVHGVHLMPFGATGEDIAEVIQAIRPKKIKKQNSKERTIPVPAAG